MTSYIYLLLRKDLSAEQQIIQAAHAAMESGLRNTPTDKISNLILLEVKNEEELKEAH